MKRITSLSLIASIALGNIADSNFYYQDYMDFGQNKGRFQAGATGLYVIDKQGKKHPLANPSVPMPDLVGTTNSGGGILTFIGGSYGYTAAHVLYDNFLFSDLTYNRIDHEERVLERGDIAYIRFNKFITSIYAPDGFLEVCQKYCEGSAKGNPLDNKERYSSFFRSGVGQANYRYPNGKADNFQGSGIRTGGVMHYSKMTQGDNYDKVEIIVGKVFSNSATKGDSGSPLWVWDNQEKKWLVVGVASRGNHGGTYVGTHTWYAVYRQHLLNTLIQRNTNPVILLNQTEKTWNNLTLESKQITKDKDIILKGGGTITLSQDIDLGNGGIYFLDSQEYTIKSLAEGGNSTTPHSWKGAGLHIAKGAIVHWQVKGKAGEGKNIRPDGEVTYTTPPDSLHKIGAGTLSVEVENGGWLNLGEGKVILNPKDGSKSALFETILLVSGRATLELTEEQGQALDPNRLFFHTRGGTLDIKGNDLTFNVIKASDNGAKIINTGNKKAKITIKKEFSSDFGKIEGSGSFFYHGDIGDNIIIYKDGESQPPCSGKLCAGYGENLLGFDGNILNPKGEIAHHNGKLVLQGHPVIHAYLSPSTQKDSVKFLQSKGEDIYTTPTRLNQEDWENRSFILDKITISQSVENHLDYAFQMLPIDNTSTFILGRNSLLLSDIFAKKTSIFFGGKEGIYIDNFDGENVANSNKITFTDYTFKQKLTKGTSQKDESFYFEGNLNAEDNTKIVVSNTDKNPLKFGTFQGIDKSQAIHHTPKSKEDGSLDLSPYTKKQVTYTISLDESSSFNANYVEFYGNNDFILRKVTKPSKLSEEAIQDFKALDPSTQTPQTSTITHLKLFGNTSKIEGNLTIGLSDSLNQQKKIQTTPDFTSSITFHSFKTILQMHSGILTLDTNTALIFDTTNENLLDLRYNTLYPLIQSKEEIVDKRNDKKINLINQHDKWLQEVTQTKNSPNQIGLIFVKNEASKPNPSPEPMPEPTPIPPKPTPTYDWFEEYVLALFSDETEEQQESRLQTVLAVLGDNRPIIEAIVKTNIQDEKIYHEVFVDKILYDAGYKQKDYLFRFTQTNAKSAESIARQGIIITSRLMHNLNSFHRSRVLSTPKKKQSHSNFIRNRSSLASLDSFEFLSSFVASDIPNQQRILVSQILNQNISSHNLWVSPRGSYFLMSGKYFDAGLSGGYDYLLNSSLFLRFGLSLHYAYAQYQQELMQERGNGVYLGAHFDLDYKKHQISLNLYGGALREDIELKNEYLSNQTQNKTNASFLFQASYKYNFEFLKKDFTHSIKPVIGAEVSYYWIPKGEFGVISYEEIKGMIPSANLGVEYQISSSSMQNTFSLLASYNFDILRHREIAFGTSPLLFNTDMQQAWISVLYNGSYDFNQDWSMNYSLGAEISATKIGYFGVNGNVGVNWRF